MVGLFALLIVPIGAIFLSRAIIASINADFVKEGLPKATAICSDSSLRSLVVESCQELDYIALMQTVGLGLAISILFLFGIIYILAKLAGSDRDRNAAFFPILAPLAIGFVSLAVLIEGGLLIFGLYEAQRQFMGSWYPVATGSVGLGALFVSFAVIRAAFSIKTKTHIYQRAIVLDDRSSPLWHFVKEIANKIDAPVPDNIVVGLEPNFYATGADVTAISGEKRVTGETLYVSLPLMRLFSTDELAAVLGHELGHFKGSDVAYTLKFAPVYQALSQAISNAAELEQIMSLPAVGTLSYIHNVFENNEKKISREREFEADKVGAQASSADGLIHALVKLAVFSGHWHELESQVIENLRQGRPVNNMSMLYAASVIYDTDDDKAREAARESGEVKIVHPTDSHPTLNQRAEALAVLPETLETTELKLPQNPSLELLPDFIEIENKLTADEQAFYIALGLASWEQASPEDESPYTAARIIQHAAAFMVCADGKVDISEIEVAEEIGGRLVPDFNSLEFRELCLTPSKLLDESELANFLGTLPKDFLEPLLEFLVEIAKSDGFIDPTEQKFIDFIKQATIPD